MLFDDVVCAKGAVLLNDLIIVEETQVVSEIVRPSQNVAMSSTMVALQKQ